MMHPFFELSRNTKTTIFRMHKPSPRPLCSPAACRGHISKHSACRPRYSKHGVLSFLSSGSSLTPYNISSPAMWQPVPPLPPINNRRRGRNDGHCSHTQSGGSLRFLSLPDHGAPPVAAVRFPLAPVDTPRREREGALALALVVAPLPAVPAGGAARGGAPVHQLALHRGLGF